MKGAKQTSLVLCAFFAASALSLQTFAEESKPGPTPWREPPPLGGGFKTKLKRSSDNQQTTQHKAARELLAQGKYEEAIPLLQAVVTNDARNDDAWNDLGFASQRLGRNADAVLHYERALTIRASRKDTRGLLGELHLTLNNLAKAEEQSEQLKQICAGGCPELETLDSQIATYKAAHPV